MPAFERRDAVFGAQLSLLQLSGSLLLERSQIRAPHEDLDLGVQPAVLVFQVFDAQNLSFCHASLTFPYERIAQGVRLRRVARAVKLRGCLFITFKNEHGESTLAR